MLRIWLFLFLSGAQTDAEVQEILIGNWSVSQHHPTGSALLTLPDKFHMRVRQASRPTSIAINIFSDSNSSIILTSFTANFFPPGNGHFKLLEGNTNVAYFDFSPLLPPHITSVGDWNGTHSFNSVMVTNKIMQLTLFEKMSSEWVVLVFEKEPDNVPVHFVEKYYRIILMGIVFLLCWAVTQCVQNRQIAKKQREAEQLLRTVAKDD
jgi:hypothetical protein